MNCHSERNSCTKLNNFYCGLHLLVNFAELADHVVNEYEKCVLDQPIGAESKSETARFSKKSESGTIRLIRTTSKCLARGADDKSGCFADFRTFINMQNASENYSGKLDRSNLLVPFRGRRFNIVFYNVEIVFFLKNYIRE